MHLIRMQCGNRILRGQVVKLPAPPMTPFSFKRSRKGETDIIAMGNGWQNRSGRTGPADPTTARLLYGASKTSRYLRGPNFQKIHASCR